MRVNQGATEVRTFLFGGIGNQLFQYAFGLRVAEEVGGFVSLDLRGIPARGQQKGSNITHLHIGCNNHYGGKQVTNYLLKVPLLRTFRGSPSPVSDSILGISRNHKGLFGRKNAIRVASYAQEVRAIDFFDGAIPISMRNEPSVPLLEDYSIVESKNVLTIHHRLGDTLRLRNTRGQLGRQFFRNAIEKATKTTKKIDHIHVHTDSPVLSRELLEDWLPGVSKSYGSIELSAAEVLTSLARARHLVLSNSTMSWWAAAGGVHDAVVSPSEWDVSGSNHLNLETWKLSDPDWT